MSTELERALVRELDEVANGVHVPPMPDLPSPPTLNAAHPFASRLRRTLSVVATVLLVGGVAAVTARPSGAPAPAGPPTDPTISTSAPTVPYVIDQRLYVDGTQVPGSWWSVESPTTTAGGSCTSVSPTGNTAWVARRPADWH